MLCLCPACALLARSRQTQFYPAHSCPTIQSNGVNLFCVLHYYFAARGSRPKTSRNADPSVIYKRPKQIWQMENNLVADFDLIQRNNLSLVLDNTDLPLHEIDPHFLLLQLYNVYKSLKGKATALRDLVPGSGDTKPGIAKDTNGASYVKNIRFRKPEDPAVHSTAVEQDEGEIVPFDASLASEEEIYLQQRRNRLDSAMPLPRKPQSMKEQDRVEAILRAQEVAFMTPDRGASARPGKFRTRRERPSQSQTNWNSRRHCSHTPITAFLLTRLKQCLTATA